MHDVLAAGHRFKLVKETDHFEVALGRDVTRRRRKTHVIARSQQPVEALGGTVLKLQIGLDHLVANLLVTTIDRLGGLMAAVMLIKDVHNIGQRAADKLMDQRFINRESQLGRARLPRLDTSVPSMSKITALIISVPHRFALLYSSNFTAPVNLYITYIAYCTFVT